MINNIVLSKVEVEEVKRLADETRKIFGIYSDVPIANDILMLLEKNEIILCEYPFEESQGSHTDAAITWYETEDGPMTFIGLNTSLYYDEQIFALAHELYHFRTKTGKAYITDIDDEDAITERKADRYAAELLLPQKVLESRVFVEFSVEDINKASKLRLLRFIARLQCEWWLPYRSIVNRLKEEEYLNDEVFQLLYSIDERDEEGEYCRILKSLDEKKYELFNNKTRRKGVSNNTLEAIIQNYEDGLIDDDHFIEYLEVFGREPSDFGFDISITDEEDFRILFEGGA